MEKDFIKAFNNRKFFNIELPYKEHKTHNLRALLRKREFYCYMTVKIWGRVILRRVKLTQQIGSIYTLTFEGMSKTYFKNIIPTDNKLINRTVYGTLDNQNSYEFNPIEVEISLGWNSIDILKPKGVTFFNVIKVDFFLECEELDLFYSKHGNKLISNIKDNYIFPLMYGKLEMEYISKHFKSDYNLIIKTH